MVGFWSYNRLKSEIKELSQLYDFTYHLYLKEHEVITHKLSDPKYKNQKVNSLTTDVGTITHSLNSLYYYTKENYPKKLRQLVLITLITDLEVYFTNLVREISNRDLEPFKSETERADYMRNHILNFSTMKSIEDDIINKDVRTLTSGGLDESAKYFMKRFKIDFKNLDIDYKAIEEIHERRHLFVHRNGICDSIYVKAYPAYGFKVGNHIQLEHDYIIHSITKILEFAGKINSACLKKFPDSKRKIKSYKGSKVFKTGEIKLLIEFETLKSKFDLKTEILDKLIPPNSKSIADYTLQHIYFEKRIQLYVSAKQKQLGQIMNIIKQNPDIMLLNRTEIDF